MRPFHNNVRILCSARRQLYLIHLSIGGDKGMQTSASHGRCAKKTGKPEKAQKCSKIKYEATGMANNEIIWEWVH